MSDAFTLAGPVAGLATLTFDLPGKRVNVFTREALEELDGKVRELAARDDIGCLVLLSGKPRNFIAGADIEAIAAVTDPAEAEAGVRAGQEIFGAWEALPFPTVAAIRGTCLGGGLEIALASNHILASDRADVRIGLPEIKLGIVPAWGGCSRLPRRIGVAAALDIILAGKSLRPQKALKVGLLDALLPDAAFEREVRAFARGVLEGAPGRRARGDLKTALLEKNPVGRKVLFSQARKQVLARTGGHYPAPLRAIEVVRRGVEEGLDAGLAAEARAVGELAVGPVSKNLIHVFQLMEAAKADGAAGEARPVESVAVLGAGVMGGGIAQLVADKAGLPVRLKDLATEPLAKGMAHAASLFAKQVARRWITKPEAARRMQLLRPTLEYSGFGSTDLVIEAIVERADIKRQVMAEVAGLTPEGTILASNTSSISIDEIAGDTPDPERVVGMHFFNPVDKMPLVEVVVGSRTSPAAAATIAGFARRLGKTPVVVQSGPGFLVNRLLAFTLAESMWLLDEGHRIEDLDRAAKGWGLPVGPFALTDEVGIDVAVHVSRIMSEAYPERLPYPNWMPRLVEDGRLGAKSGRGFYRYEKGKRTGPDPGVYTLLGLRPTVDAPDPARLVERTILPMVNEAARCLDEKIVAGAGQLDLAMILGTGFPPFRGGLCRWADAQGLEPLAREMESWAARLGERFQPSAALRRAAEAGGFYHLWP